MFCHRFHSAPNQRPYFAKCQDIDWGQNESGDKRSPLELRK